MREILFRGKRTDCGKWIEGGLWIYIDEPHIIGAANCRGFKVIPETLGQYTGLKDKNGRKIFEGDIVHCTARLDEANCVVIFEEGEFRLIPERRYKTYVEGGGYHALCCFGKEVIGNIYDNPELLEVTI